MAMLATLADRISLAPLGGDRDTLHVTGLDAGPPDDNLVLRALAAARAAVGGGWAGGPGPAPALAARLDKLCVTAEIAEHIAYLKAFAIFPAAAALHGRAREGVRSSIASVFQAIACRNPYPFDHFDEAAWNQMVVKCVFVGTPIETIVGLAERRNPELIHMLRDFVAERHAAGLALVQDVARVNFQDDWKADALGGGRGVGGAAG